MKKILLILCLALFVNVGFIGAIADDSTDAAQPTLFSPQPELISEEPVELEDLGIENDTPKAEYLRIRNQYLRKLRSNKLIIEAKKRLDSEFRAVYSLVNKPVAELEKKVKETAKEIYGRIVRNHKRIRKYVVSLYNVSNRMIPRIERRIESLEERVEDVTVLDDVKSELEEVKTLVSELEEKLDDAEDDVVYRETVLEIRDIYLKAKDVWKMLNEIADGTDD